MEDLTSNLCWKLVNKEGHIAIWQKPLNNSCYLNRNPDVKPSSLCDTNDDPDNIWYICLFHFLYSSLSYAIYLWNIAWRVIKLKIIKYQRIKKFHFSNIVIFDVLQECECEGMHNPFT